MISILYHQEAFLQVPGWLMWQMPIDGVSTGLGGCLKTILCYLYIVPTPYYICLLSLPYYNWWAHCVIKEHFVKFLGDWCGRCQWNVDLLVFGWCAAAIQWYLSFLIVYCYRKRNIGCHVIVLSINILRCTHCELRQICLIEKVWDHFSLGNNLVIIITCRAILSSKNELHIQFSKMILFVVCVSVSAWEWGCMCEGVYMCVCQEEMNS